MYNQGYGEGQVDALLLVVESRGIALQQETKERLATCYNRDQLAAWLRRASTAERAEDVLHAAENDFENWSRGRAHGQGEMVLKVLEARGITVTDAFRRRITSCTDLDQLAVWAERGASACRFEDLFTE